MTGELVPLDKIGDKSSDDFGAEAAVASFNKADIANDPLRFALSSSFTLVALAVVVVAVVGGCIFKTRKKKEKRSTREK